MCALTIGIMGKLVFGVEARGDRDTGEFQWMLFLGPLVISLAYQDMSYIDVE